MINRIVPTSAALAPTPYPPAPVKKPEWKHWHQYVDPVEHFIADHPGICLASALALGVALAWLIKRR